MASYPLNRHPFVLSYQDSVVSGATLVDGTQLNPHHFSFHSADYNMVESLSASVMSLARARLTAEAEFQP